MTVLWVLLGVLYVVVLITLGLATLRKGHLILFIFGFFVPFMWLLGGLMPPTRRAAAALGE
jgi:hypothetical protein